MPRKKDIGWQFCTKGNKYYQVTCNFCGKRMSGGPTRVKYHLAQIRGWDVTLCPNAPLEVQERCKFEIVSMKKRQKMKRRITDIMAGRSVQPPESNITTHKYSPDVEMDSSHGSAHPDSSIFSAGAQTVHHSLPVDKRHLARKALAELWYTFNMPLNCFNHPVTQDLFDMITGAGPRFKLPSYHDMNTTLLEDIKRDIDKSLDEQRICWRQNGCSILCEVWSDRKEVSVLNFIVACGSGMMFLKCVDVSGNLENAEYLYNVIGGVVIEIGEENVFQVITRNQAAFVSAGKMLMNAYPHLYWAPCLVHSIDLVLEDLGEVQWICNAMIIAKRITRFIYGNPLVHNLLTRHTQGIEIIQCKTSGFSANFVLLQRLWENRGKVRNMFLCKEWMVDRRFQKLHASNSCKLIRKYVFDDSYWKQVECALQVIAPLLELLYLVVEEGLPIGEAYEALSNTTKSVRNYSRSKLSKTKYDQIVKLIDNWWNNFLHIDLYAAAHILNPKYGFGSLTKPSAGNCELSQGITRALDKLAKKDRYIFDKLIGEMLRYRLKDAGMFKLEPVEKNAYLMSSYQWWMEYGYEVPRLSAVAFRILPQPCCSSGLEFNDDLFHQMHAKRHNKFATKRLNDVIFVHYNLKLKYYETMAVVNSELDLDEVDESMPIADWIMYRESTNFSVQEQNASIQSSAVTPYVKVQFGASHASNIHYQEDEREEEKVIPNVLNTTADNSTVRAFEERLIERVKLVDQQTSKVFPPVLKQYQRRKKRGESIHVQ